ncbi:oligosaccharide repeat unit polymerase [Gammaproteobacteria bacterium]|nr:oligosaccharide repeat unit polymerase [Gammaproteobacteria bacterium]
MLDITIPILAIILLINGVSVFKTGGLSKHYIHLYILGASFYFLTLAPVVTGIEEDFLLYTNGWGSSVDIGDIFDFGMMMLVIHFICYTIGYLLVVRVRNAGAIDYSALPQRKEIGQVIGKSIFYVFLVLYGVIFLNTLAGGINLIDIFMGTYGKPTLGLRGYTYYLQNFADSLITLLVAALFFKIKPRYFRIMLMLAIPLFLVLGFRYRIILLVFGLGMIYLRDNRVRLVPFLKALSFVIIFLYSMLLLTHNRAAIYMQQWDKMSYDYTQFPYEAFIEQAKGSRIDFALYQALSDGRIDHDLGLTTFVYPFIKFTPSFIFEGGKKPYPPPQINDIHVALSSSMDIGEAVTSLGSAYYSFGVVGVIIFGLGFGLVIGRLQNHAGKSRFSALFSIVVSLALFMWMTRGYMPGFVDHLAYLLIPVFILKYTYGNILRRRLALNRSIQ